MRKKTGLLTIAIAAITLLTVTNTASAGEPFHPIVELGLNFFRRLFGF